MAIADLEAKIAEATKPPPVRHGPVDHTLLAARHRARKSEEVALQRAGAAAKFEAKLVRWNAHVADKVERLEWPVTPVDTSAVKDLHGLIAALEPYAPDPGTRFFCHFLNRRMDEMHTADLAVYQMQPRHVNAAAWFFYKTRWDAVLFHTSYQPTVDPAIAARLEQREAERQAREQAREQKIRENRLSPSKRSPGSRSPTTSTLPLSLTQRFVTSSSPSSPPAAVNGASIQQSAKSKRTPPPSVRASSRSPART